MGIYTLLSAVGGRNGTKIACPSSKIVYTELVLLSNIQRLSFGVAGSISLKFNLLLVASFTCLLGN